MVDKPDRTGLAAECAARRARALTAADELGLTGLLVWSRGGSSYDRYADVYYLANHYMAFVHVVDNPPHWASRGHCALVMPLHGEPALLLPADNWRPDEVTVGDVRVDQNLPALTAAVLREKGLERGRLGLVGADVLTLHTFNALSRVLPEIEIVEADDILRRLRLVKSPRELEAVRRSCALGSRVVETIMRTAQPGRTEAEAAAAGTAMAITAGAAVYGISIGSGPFSHLFASTALTGYDSTRALQEGDLFHLDSVTVLDGYYCDFGRSSVIGGRATRMQRALLETAIGTVDAIVAAVRPGVTARDLAIAGDHFMREAGAAEKGYAAMTKHSGHSLGLTWEAPWIMIDDETVLQEGMVLAVEKGVAQSGVGMACYEDNVIVTSTGAEVITTAPRVWWR